MVKVGKCPILGRENITTNVIHQLSVTDTYNQLLIVN